MESGLRARHHHHPPPPPSQGREDCWSEGATAALVEAWGDRYLQLSRGNLRQKDWKEVADAVNARQEELGKPRKTDVQCKNRVDTVKKKYKLEKSRPGPSQWPFFSRLDLLVGQGSGSGSGSTAAVKKPLHPPPFANPRHTNPSNHRHPSVTFTVKHRNPNPSPNTAGYSGGSSSRSLVNSPLSTQSSREETGGRDDDDEGNDVYDEDDEDTSNGLFGARKQRRRWGSFVGCSSGGGGGVEGAFGELAKAVLKIADIYERVESSKQQQMMELERQRMEFAKDLEFQRMQMFMEAQLELEKMKRPKYELGSGKRL